MADPPEVEMETGSSFSMVRGDQAAGEDGEPKEQVSDGTAPEATLRARTSTGSSRKSSLAAPTQEIMQEFSNLRNLDILEKAEIQDVMLNRIMQGVDVALMTMMNIQFPNKYRISNNRVGELFYAIDTSSTVTQRGSEALVNFDVFHVRGDNPTRAFRISRQNRKTMVTTDLVTAGMADLPGPIAMIDAASGATLAELDEDIEAWCCPFKQCSKPCCHADSCPDSLGSCCLCLDATYYIKDPQFRQTGQRRASVHFDYSPNSPSMLAVKRIRRLGTNPFCDGCCGEGMQFVIEQDTPSNSSAGTEIGRLVRDGRGCCSTWCMPTGSQRAWRLEFDAATPEKYKALLMLLVIAVDRKEETVAD